MIGVRSLTLAAILVIVGSTIVLAQDVVDLDEHVYADLNDLPNAVIYLPAPPDSSSMDFVDDMVQWQWGKTQRLTNRGIQASNESHWLPFGIAEVMAEALGIDTISDEATPALSKLLIKTYNTGGLATELAKMEFMRRRPFMSMNDPLWAEYDSDLLRADGSYPSGHTAFGWATALAFAEMWPELQDTILRRGFQFGENRVITGAHYQSDVNAGYICGAASLASAHVNPRFKEDLLAARAEYAVLKGLPADYDPTARVKLPRGVNFLNLPVDTANYRYIGDLMRYWNAKALRGTDRGDEAVANAAKSAEYMAELFGRVMGITISAESTPALYGLIKTIKANSSSIADTLKASNFRKRPYVQLGESTPVPGDEGKSRGTTSFASYHSCLGWALSLAFAEVAPEHQNDILACGFQYGHSRLIVGYHWATDIEAARLLACALIARLHADAEFCFLLEQAKAEYKRETNGMSSVPQKRDEHSGAVYSVNGMRHTTRPVHRGIFIENGRKEVVK